MTVPTQTKITITVWERLFDGFSKTLDSCFIKRDAFLNHIIYKELHTLERDLGNSKNSAAARRYITSELHALGTKKINVVVDKSVAERLNNIVKKHNLSRDGFINRLLFLLALPDKALAKIFGVELTRNASYIDDVDLELQPRGFKEGLTHLLEDPNYYIQAELDAYFGTDDEFKLKRNIYTKTLKPAPIVNLPERDGFLLGLSCYLEDSEVPNTDAWKEKQKALNDFDTDVPIFFFDTDETGKNV